jgi:uncharacterized protein (DUF885 family)
MTTSDIATVPLSRPAPSPHPGPLDETLYDLVEERFRHTMQVDPTAATLAGIHTEDHRLADGSRDAVEQEIADAYRHLTAVETLDPAALSPEASFERDLELHNTRRTLFDLEVARLWERRSTAMDGIGDALFLLFARDFAPLPERLDAVAGRLEDVPRYLDANRTRPRGPQVRLWQELEIRSATEMVGLFEDLTEAGRGVLGPAEQRRIEAAAARASTAVSEYAGWLRDSLAGGVEDWPLGRERFDELVRLRAFDGLDSDAILEIGIQQLAENKALRAAAAREIDPTVDEATVIDRLKDDQPATFEAALEGYRDAMYRSRRHLIEHDIVTVPPDERLVVIETPAYQRNLLPFAAYFEPAKFDIGSVGIYVVTPSVDGDPKAMREHNWSSISNASIHEAYPGHHLQFSVAIRNPSLTRYSVDAPEFVEGWGMYSEQLMREQGFDDAPNFRVSMYTDAIWRACRIILDVRMHRGELSVDEATDFLVRETDFETANALAEVRRYTYTPTYQTSYLLGKMMLLQLREEERRRLGEAFSLRRFHDALLEAGSLPISFHRRLQTALHTVPADPGVLP